MTWWSNKYNRPLKDPLLLSYTLEELALEYHTHEEAEKAAEESRKELSDKIEAEKEQEALDWADEEEARELAELEGKVKEKPKNYAEDPNNKEWMKKIIEEEKAKHGSDFGEDVTINFNEK